MDDSPLKKQKKCEFGEEDVCNLFQRYSAAQVLTLLREVAQSLDVKIDWNELVKNTETGITNAREYQILWRHLAYRHPLPEKMEGEGNQPLDDDSDLECELEATPPVSTELAVEAANCVKVLAFGSLNESSMPNSSAVDGDVPNGHSSKASSEKPHPASLLHSSNPALLVSVQKQPQAGGPSGEGFDGYGLANNNFPARRKRKPWSEEEDLELMAAVKKFGEGNWAHIVKGEFKGDRTASQLSQRWAIIRKKQGSLNTGGALSQLSEAQLATRRAIDMALKDSIAAGCSTVGNGAGASNGDVPSDNNAASSQPQNTHVTNTISTKPAAVSMATAKPRPPPKKVPPKPSVTDPIQAAAKAAGARIASPSDAATIMKAAQSKNAVRIIGSGSSLIKSSATGNSPLPPNVHFIRTGLVANTPTSLAAGGGPQTKGSILKPTIPNVPVSQLSKAQTAPSSSANELQKMEDKASSTEVKVLVSDVKPVVKVPVSDAKPVVKVHEDNAASLSKCSPKSPRKGLDSDPGKQTVDSANSQNAMNKGVVKSECKDESSADNDKQCMVQESQNLNMKGSHGVSSSSVVNGDGAEKKETSSEAEKSDAMDR